jgi:hypothetical protein
VLAGFYKKNHGGLPALSLAQARNAAGLLAEAVTGGAASQVQHRMRNT